MSELQPDAPAPPLSRRRVELHLPRLSPAAAADQPPRPAGGRGLWLYDDAVEAGRRAQPSKADGPTHMAVILDASEKTHRNEMYDQYKANRPPPPEDLVPQFPLIRVATRAFSIPCIEEEGLEADDIIACYVMAAKKAGWKVTIVSSDKDLMQLIEDGSVDMLDTMNDRRIGARAGGREVRGRAGEGRRRAGADGRQRRQCAGRAGHRPQDRAPADPAIWRPRDGARQRSTRSPSPSSSRT